MNRFVAFRCDGAHQMVIELTPCHGHCYPGDGAALVVATSEATSATERAQVPWKGAPGRVRAPYGPHPAATRGAVAESGCLGMQPKSGGGKRVGVGDAPRPDAERRRAGPPLGSRRWPLPAVAPAGARAFDAQGHTADAVGCTGACALRRASRGSVMLSLPARGLPIRPVLKHGPRSLTCVRADGCESPEGARKLMRGIPIRGAPRTDPDLM
ncbi:hypothetical protein AXF42_Ash005594 [Apostasia shenzhenica]|uniref:Uncharacterized protein n=1 Tax=Apostasia shenzhenica TaxID=1088818 RepID=A0A2I0BBU7_9ASPA|nr:hypothetical protein AXF42_Ash005594 [Apostasia shenzhenica]